MQRRLHHEQPESFAFTPANQEWAEAQITKFPEGREASAIIPLLWRAHEQEGWLTRPAIEGVADMLGMPYIRALEVATFYYQFQLQPVGSVANIQVCGTTSCMICGAEDLMAVCREKIAATPHTVSADGKFSWEEVECQGACSNAPMAMIGQDYYEDLTAERLGEIIDELAAGSVPVPGPQNGRYASEPKSGLTSLKDFDSGQTKYNASAQRAVDLGETVKRIDGTEVPLLAPWRDKGAMHKPAKPNVKVLDAPLDMVKETGRIDADKAAKGDAATSKAKPKQDVGAEGDAQKPAALNQPREAGADDLKMIKGIGPKLEKLLNSLGFYHFDQIAAWSESEVAWVDDSITGFKGRATRDEWIAQAKVLAAGGDD